MKKINKNKPYVTFKVEDGKLVIEAVNYPVVNGKCTGLQATEAFEQELGADSSDLKEIREAGRKFKQNYQQQNYQQNYLEQY